MKRPVLVLGAAPRITLAIARSLRRHHIPVEVAIASSHEGQLRSTAVDECWRVPDAERNPEEFVRALARIAERRRADMLIPANDTAFAAVIRNYQALADLLILACPPSPVADRVLDKNLTLAAARECGIPVPETFVVSSSSQAEEAAGQLRFPLIAKPQKKYRDSSIKFRQFQNISELKTFWGQHRNLPQMLLQSYVSGHGVGVEILLHRGKCLAAFQHRRLKEFPHTGGVSVVAVAEAPDPVLVELACQLLQALQWEGVAMVEFKADPYTGRAVLMEVNGRFWGSLSLPIQAGIDFPFYVWQLAHGETPSVPSTYEAGARWRWSAGYLRRLHGVVPGALRPGAVGAALRRDILGSLGDFAPPVRDALWSVFDPMPAVVDLAQACRDMVCADLRSLRKRLVPDPLLQSNSRLGRRERAIYLAMRLLRTLRLRRDQHRNISLKARSFVFICHGNVMRSPMCEALFLKNLEVNRHDGVSVISAGLNAVPGRAAEPRARKVAPEFGVSLEKHQAQLVTVEMVERADAIFAMDFENEAHLLARYPQAFRKVFMLRSYADSSNRQVDIPDPYWGDEADVRGCYQILEECIRNLVKTLSRERQGSDAGVQEFSGSR